MQNDDIFYQKLAEQDYTYHNLQVIKHCKEQAENAVLDRTADYPAKSRLATINGILRWDLLDHYLEQAANNQLFDGITAKWIKYEGAPILELHGKNTVLTAKHVLSKEEKITESENGYRKNNQAKNQKNQLLLKELQEPNSEDTKPNIVLVHGDGFAYLRILLDKSDVPELTTNIMLMPSLDAAPETEFVPQPMPVLNPKKVVSEPEALPEISLKKKTNDHSQS
jgi:hypothetical protein